MTRLKPLVDKFCVIPVLLLAWFVFIFLYPALLHLFGHDVLVLASHQGNFDQAKLIRVILVGLMVFCSFAFFYLPLAYLRPKSAIQKGFLYSFCASLVAYSLTLLSGQNIWVLAIALSSPLMMLLVSLYMAFPWWAQKRLLAGQKERKGHN